MSHIHHSIENKILFSKYKPDKKLGEGSFGKIYSAHNINTGEKYALKLESKRSSQSLLEQEAYLLYYLKGEGIPFVKSYGFSGNYNVLVMELLGKSLEDLFQENHNRFSIKTVCMLGIQMISRLEYVHSKHIIHRDIKPDNFTIGLGENSKKVYVIDFGLSKKYRSSRTLIHIRYSENKKLTGTARYASIHALKGCEQGRRDDMEALGYVLLYFLRGRLPWQGLKVKKNEDRYKKIYEKKKSTSAEELCSGFPIGFTYFVNNTRSLKFEEEPNYEFLRNLLTSILNGEGFIEDLIFDWNIQENDDSKKNDNLVNNKNINKNFFNGDKNINNVITGDYNNGTKDTLNSKDAMEKNDKNNKEAIANVKNLVDNKLDICKTDNIKRDLNLQPFKNNNTEENFNKVILKENQNNDDNCLIS